MRATWDRALMGTANLWNCEAIHSGPALYWLYPGEHTFLLLVGQTGITNKYLAVTDRIEGHEFVDALNTLIATGSLPTELLPFR